MKKLFARFMKDNSGATAIEYGLIAAGISVAIIAVVNGLGTSLNSKFQSISNSARRRQLSSHPSKLCAEAPATAGAFSYGRAGERMIAQKPGRDLIGMRTGVPRDSIERDRALGAAFSRAQTPAR